MKNGLIPILLCVVLSVGLGACGTEEAAVTPPPKGLPSPVAQTASSTPQLPQPEESPPLEDLMPVPPVEGMVAIDLGRMAFCVPDSMEVTTAMDGEAHVATAVLGDTSYLFYGYDADLPFSMEYMDQEMREGYAAKMAEEAGSSYSAMACAELGNYPFAVYNIPLTEEGYAALVFHTVVDGSAYTMLVSAEGRSIDEDDAAAAGLAAMTLTAKEAVE